MTRRFLISVAAACVSMLASINALAFDKPPFPRIAVVWVSNQNYQDPNIQKQLARASIAQISVWPGWENNRGTTLEQVLQNVKAINPKLLVFNYIKNNEIDGNRSTYPMFSELFDKLDAMHWYLYPAGTSGTAVPAAWAGATSINNTLFTAKDSSGLNWVDWFAQWAVNKYAVPAPSLDGFVTDNVFWKPAVNGDWNLDGNSDGGGGAYQNSAGLWLFDAEPSQLWQRQGYVEHFAKLHQLMPGKYQLGNIGGWGDPLSTLTEYNGKLEGGSLEGMIGWSWSVETWSGWQGMMAWYRKTMAALADPKLAMFQQVGNVTDYQSVRYGLASCLMDDGYFQFGSGSNGDFPWYDEYSFNLGYARAAPTTTAWQKGVYRRDFDNGIVLVNPKGNGPQTVTVEAGFKHINGSQVPAINNGQSVQTITLQDRDGVILARVTPLAPVAPQKKPNAPSALTVH
jgi:hypothetical protein